MKQYAVIRAVERDLSIIGIKNTIEEASELMSEDFIKHLVDSVEEESKCGSTYAYIRGENCYVDWVIQRI